LTGPEDSHIPADLSSQANPISEPNALTLMPIEIWRLCENFFRV